MLIKLGCSGMAVPGGMITLSHFLRLHCESRKINEETHYVTTGVASTREGSVHLRSLRAVHPCAGEGCISNLTCVGEARHTSREKESRSRIFDS